MKKQDEADIQEEKDTGMDEDRQGEEYTKEEGKRERELYNA